MKVLSVNVGRLTQLPGVKEVGQTGIFKTPADGPVMVTTLALSLIHISEPTRPY